VAAQVGAAVMRMRSRDAVASMKQTNAAKFKVYERQKSPAAKLG
jgi:hypothetical protein